MKLIVGLGNPGDDYAGTRHNIGFEAVDALAGRLGWTDRKNSFDRQARSQFDALTMDGVVGVHCGGSEKVLLLKPQTYMNLSGQSVRAAMDFYRIDPAGLMVILDDLALACGRIRIRAGGSDGGHNGLKDIARALGSDQYPRLRIGIDSPPPPMPGRDYVLGRFTPAQRALMDPALDRAVLALLAWIEKGLGPAMNQFNASPTEATG